jgi:hypothetical protein
LETALSKCGWTPEEYKAGEKATDPSNHENYDDEEKREHHH